MCFAFLQILLLSGYAQAALPEWASRSSFEDEANHYFVGRGSGDSLAKAYDSARADAGQAAIRELFGFSTRIFNQSVETTEESNFQSNKVELSKSVRFRGFKEVDSYSTKDNDAYQVWVKYKYSKAEAQKELQRLAQVPDDEVNISVVAVQFDSKKLKAEGSYRRSDLNVAQEQHKSFTGLNNSVTVSVMGLSYQRLFTPYISGLMGISFGSLTNKTKEEIKEKTMYGNNSSYDLSVGITLKYPELDYFMIGFLSLYGGITHVKIDSQKYGHYGYEVGVQFLLGEDYALTSSYLQKFGTNRGHLNNIYDGIFNFGLVYSW